MIRTQIVCDLCEKPFPTETEETPFGPVEVIKGVGRTKVWNTRGLFQHLCENCALKIDNALLEVQLDMARERELNIRNGKLNAERREKLGTNG